jgi:hypothetical protein
MREYRRRKYEALLQARRDERALGLTRQEYAWRFRLTVRTLRKWEQEGVIPPRVRTPAGQLLYFWRDINATWKPYRPRS